MNTFKSILEGSFTELDIPSKFYCVIYFDLKNTEALEQLAIMRLSGVQGISDAKIIISQLLGEGNREALLVMPGLETARMNQLSRVLYDNYDYLVSRNFASLIRLRNGGGFAGLKALMVELAWAVGGELVEQSEDGPLWSMGKAMVVTSVQNHLVNRLMKAKINSVRQFAFWLKTEVADITKAESIKDVSVDDLIGPIQAWLDNETQYVKSEGEWLVKDKNLIIPPKSDLFILIPPIPNYVYEDWKSQTINPDLLKNYKIELETFERILTTIKSYNFDSKFRVRLLNSTKFKQAKQRILDNNQ